MYFRCKKDNRSLPFVIRCFFGLFGKDSARAFPVKARFFGERPSFGCKTNLQSRATSLHLPSKNLEFNGFCKASAPNRLLKARLVLTPLFGPAIFIKDFKVDDNGKCAFSCTIPLQEKLSYLSLYGKVDGKGWHRITQYRISGRRKPPRKISDTKNKSLESRRPESDGQGKKADSWPMVRDSVGQKSGNTDVKQGVAFIFFRRPKLTRLVFEQIRIARPPVLLFIADGPRNEEEAYFLEECKGIVEKVDWPCEVHRNYSDIHLGCKERVATGLAWGFSICEELIILEDDCLPSPSFFTFCMALLSYYRHDARIMHISGSSFTRTGVPNDASYYFSRHSDIWGWATWRRAFEKYDPNMGTWTSFMESVGASGLPGDQNEVEYWIQSLNDVREGRVDTWDFQWHFTVFSNNGLACVPRLNLITNLGFGPGATHTLGADSSVAMLYRHELGEVKHPGHMVPSRKTDASIFLNRYINTSEHRLEQVRFGAPLPSDNPWQLVITHNEISERHGTGALLVRLLRDVPRLLNIRTASHHPRVDLDIDCHLLASGSGDTSQAERCRQLLHISDHREIARILVVPFTEEECLIALAAKHIFGAEITLYLMDDQNIHHPNIRDSIFTDLIVASTRRFAICDALGEAYERKFKCPFETLLPAMDDQYLQIHPLDPVVGQNSSAVMIGNVWTHEWLERLTSLAESSGISIDWYGNVGEPFINRDAVHFEKKGVTFKGFLQESQLIQQIRKYPYAIVPTAEPQNDSGHAWMAFLSFPSKIITLTASGNLPIVLIGPDHSPGAKFVIEKNLGMVVPYQKEDLQRCHSALLNMEEQAVYRKSAAAVAHKFSVSKSKALLGLN